MSFGLRTGVLSVLSLLASVSQGAEASVIDSDNFYAVDIQYSAIAYGKAVESVLAHLGVEKRHEDFLGKPTTWEDVTDVVLSKNGDAFVGKAGLRVSGYSGSISATLTPVVQYFVSFKDGTRLISDVHPISREGSEQFQVYYESDAERFVKVGQELVEGNAVPVSTRVVLQGTIWGWGMPSDRLTECLQKSTLLTVYPD